MTIKPLAPRVCPQCQSELSFRITPEKIECRQCGYVLRGEDSRPLQPPSQPPAVPAAPKALRPSYAITTRGTVSAWARAAFDTGQDMIGQGKYDEAVQAFKRAITYQEDFLDPHLWIARIVDDPDQKREHLEIVLAYDLNHLEATRELMILRGELDPNAPTLDPYAVPQRVSAGGAVSTRTQNVRCPRCGAPSMTTDDMTGLVTCGACGFVDADAARRADGNASGLAGALLKRRSQAIIWEVGERLLHCNACGAERTLPATALSDQCPYCGSSHVIQVDALGSFQQPDGLLPFSVSRQQAGEKIKEKLGTWSQRVAGFFGDNRVERASLEGIYVPFWMFDASIEVQRTTVNESPGVGYSREAYRRGASQSAYQSETLYDGMTDIAVCAVKTPSALLTRQLGKFDLETLTAYDPRLLAAHTAQIYEIDFDKASLEARSQISDAMRERHAVTAREGVRVNVFALVKSMSFQLILAPVWVATLYEADGDVRPALVNGQSGRVALGKPKKPK